MHDLLPCIWICIFENLRIRFKNVEPILQSSASGFQNQQTDQPMGEMLKSIKEPRATVFQLRIEANFQAHNLSPRHPYIHHTFRQITAPSVLSVDNLLFAFKRHA